MEKWLHALQAAPDAPRVYTASHSPTDARTAARVLQTARVWRGRGGVLLTDYGGVVALFGSAMQRGAVPTALDTDLFRLFSSVGLMVVDEVQLACATFRKARPLAGTATPPLAAVAAPTDARAAREARLRGKAEAGACSVRVLDVLHHLRPRHVVAVANAACDDVADGNSVERSENRSAWTRTAAALGRHRTLALDTGAVTKLLTTGAPAARAVSDMVVTVPLARVQTALLTRGGGSLGCTVRHTLARLVHLHPALLLTEAVSPRAWADGFTPSTTDQAVTPPTEARISAGVARDVRCCEDYPNSHHAWVVPSKAVVEQFLLAECGVAMAMSGVPADGGHAPLGDVRVGAPCGAVFDVRLSGRLETLLVIMREYVLSRYRVNTRTDVAATGDKDLPRIDPRNRPTRIVVFVHNTAAENLLNQWQQLCTDIDVATAEEPAAQVPVLWEFPHLHATNRRQKKRTCGCSMFACMFSDVHVRTVCCMPLCALVALP